MPAARTRVTSTPALTTEAARARGRAGVIASRRMSRPRGNAGQRPARRRQPPILTGGPARPSRPSRPPGALALAGLALVGLTLTACPDRNRGISPDGAGLFFPAGTVLDPRVEPGTPARWMFVLNANSDLVFNSGTLLPVDLDSFYSAWMRAPDLCFQADGAACSADEPCVGSQQTCEAGVCATDNSVRAEACKVGRPASATGPGPWADWPVVGDVDADLTEDVPCRHNILKPQVIECEDTFFIDEDAAVFIGNFGTSLRTWVPNPKNAETRKSGAKLMVAVRGDPSITLIDVEGDLDGPPELHCGEGVDSGQYDPRRCAGASLLRFVRNESDGTGLGAEPANILAIDGDPRLLVTHATRPQVTVIDLEGQYSLTGQTGTCKGAEPNRVCKDGIPAIVHTPTIFDLNGQLGGGWGLARRPCFPGTENVPALTVTRGPDGAPIDCGRSLIYAGFRTNLVAARTFLSEGQPLDTDYLALLLTDLEGRIVALLAQIAATTNPDEKAALQADLAELKGTQARYLEWLNIPLDSSFGQRCLTVGEVDADELVDDDLTDPPTNGAFLCDVRLYTAGAFRAAAFDIGVSGTSAVLGDIAFSADGNRMFAVQTAPGALVYVDTSLDGRKLTRDASAGVVELCAQPTAMTLFSDGANEYAAVTCYKPKELFIVDLSGVRVVANLLLGTGSHAMTVDHARQYLYVSNSLDKTISVVDIGRLRPTRFSEVARIGRQVPYLR